MFPAGVLLCCSIACNGAIRQSPRTPTYPAGRRRIAGRLRGIDREADRVGQRLDALPEPWGRAGHWRVGHRPGLRPGPGSREPGQRRRPGLRHRSLMRQRAALVAAGADHAGQARGRSTEGAAANRRHRQGRAKRGRVAFQARGARQHMRIVVGFKGRGKLGIHRGHAPMLLHCMQNCKIAITRSARAALDEVVRVAVRAGS